MQGDGDGILCDGALLRLQRIGLAQGLPVGIFSGSIIAGEDYPIVIDGEQGKNAGIVGDTVGVTDIALLIDGTEVELNAENSYTIKKAELKNYTITAKAYDEETNEEETDE